MTPRSGRTAPRRMAARRGLHLSKSARRDPGALDYGLFALIDIRTGKAIHPPLMGQFVHSWTLDDVEKHLLEKPARERQAATTTRARP